MHLHLGRMKKKAMCSLPAYHPLKKNKTEPKQKARWALFDVCDWGVQRKVCTRSGIGKDGQKTTLEIVAIRRPQWGTWRCCRLFTLTIDLLSLFVGCNELIVCQRLPKRLSNLHVGHRRSYFFLILSFFLVWNLPPSHSLNLLLTSPERTG